MASYRKTGKENVRMIAKASGTAIAVGDLVKVNGTSNNVTAATSGAALLGIAQQAGASASTTAIPVDILSPGDQIVTKAVSGTPASGDFKSCDIADATGAAVGTNTNHDFLYQFNGTTDTVDAWPQKLQTATAS